MHREKTDQRIIRTKRKIYDGLLTTLKSKTFDEIKISEICKIAKINRTTFYTHFNDKYDLFKIFMQDLQKDLIKELEKPQKITNLRVYYTGIIKIILNHIYDHKDIYKTIIMHNKYNIVIDDLQDTIYKCLIEKKMENNKVKKIIPMDFAAAFYMGGILNISMGWIIKSDNYSLDEIYHFIDLLLPNKNKK